MPSFDAIVVGLGGMGGAALYHLARRGLRVLGLEQFDIGHDRGSSHGETRIIRRAYFEHPDYVPLVDRAYELWREAETASGVSLVRKTGLFLAGRVEGEIISGTRRAAALHRLAIEDVSNTDCRRRFPGLVPGPEMAVLFEPDAGYVEVDRAVRTHVDLAVAAGAKILTGQRVAGWSSTGSNVLVQTEKESFSAERLVLCAGAWSDRLLRGLRLPLEVHRKIVLWLECIDTRYRLEKGCPVYGFENDGRFFYGFPSLDGFTVKVAEHTGTCVVDPDVVDRGLHSVDSEAVIAFIRGHLPGISDRVARHSICLYSMTTDRHFVVDRHPEFERVVFAAGFSGHGFKFAPIIGSVLTDLTIGGATSEPVGFLRLNRPSLKAG